MYLVFDPHTNTPVFTDEDPRNDDFHEPVIENVTLDRPQDGPAGPLPQEDRVLGVSRMDESRYRVFDSADECENANFQPVSAWQGNVYDSWSDYARARLGL